jgi:hypothetical protein
MPITPPRPPRNPGVLPPITRQHEKREVKEDLGNPYEFWTRQGMIARDGGLMKRPILKYVL